MDSAPYGRVYTQVVRILGEVSMTTSEGIAERIWGKPDGALVPTAAAVRAADLMMAKMVKLTGLVREVRPRTRGKLWALTEDGTIALAELDAPPRPRSYKTSDIRRLKQEHRRNTQSERQDDGTRRRCINENQAGTHGPPTHGCRCYACYKTHRGEHDDSRARGDRTADSDRGPVGTADEAATLAVAAAGGGA